MTSARFIWEAGDLVPAETVSGLTRPAWPKSMTDLPATKRLADWVQERLPDAFEQWDDNYCAEIRDLLTRTEKAKLIEAFNGKAVPGRWARVAAILNTGEASRRFVTTVARLIELGGFGPRANLTGYSQVEAARDRDLVHAVLRADFPERPPQSASLMATKIAAILLHPASGVPDKELLRSQTADVRKAMKHRTDRKDELEYLCWRVVEDRTAG